MNLHELLGQLNIAKRAALVAQTVKNHPVMQETQVRSLVWKDPLEKEMATHFSILAWRITLIEELGGLQSMGSQRVRHDWATNTHTHILTHTHTILPPERKSCLFNILIHEVEIKFCFYKESELKESVRKWIALFLNLLGWVSFQISYH